MSDVNDIKQPLISVIFIFYKKRNPICDFIQHYRLVIVF